MSEYFSTAFWAAVFFENSNDKAQVTGNFDGMGLTCGFLGLVFAYGEQQKLVQEFNVKYPGKLMDLMPNCGSDYLHLCNLSMENGTKLISSWSNGERVIEPNKSELVRLWNSDEMIELQMKNAQEDFGGYAEKMTKLFCSYFKCQSNLNIYSFFYDVKVLNGSMKDISFSQVSFDRVTLEQKCTEALNWGSELSNGYGYEDTNSNSEEWRDNLKTCETWKLQLLHLGYLRSLECRDEFKGICFSRKGIMIFGTGMINGERYTMRKR